MKKYIKFLILFLVVSISVPVQIARAELSFDEVWVDLTGDAIGGKCGENARWTLLDNTITVSGEGKMYDYGNDYFEYEDRRWLYYWEDIKHIVIEEGITAIGDYVFHNMHNVETVSIASTVVSIGTSAFGSCSNLTSAQLPDSIKSIKSYAFVECNKLEYVSFPNSLEEIKAHSFRDCGLTSVSFPNSLKKVGYEAFSGCGSLTSVVIPDSVTMIESRAFEGCDALADVHIGKNVNYIGENAFRNTALSLNEENWENGLLYIGEYLVEAKHDFSSFDIKDGTKLIAREVFYRFQTLTSVTMPNSLLYIGEDAFIKCRNLKTVKFSDSLLKIEAHAFTDCVNLELSALPDSVETINGLAFWGCSKVDIKKLPSSLEDIGGNAFLNTATYKKYQNWDEYGCFYIEDILLACKEGNEYIPVKDGTKIIASGAFFDNDKVKSVVVPKSVKIICSAAFKNCDKLEKVTMYNGLEKIGLQAFYASPQITTLSIPQTVTIIEEKAIGYAVREVLPTEYLMKNFVIIGSDGSAAQAYAKENDLVFVGMDKEFFDENDSSSEDVTTSEAPSEDVNTSEAPSEDVTTSESTDNGSDGGSNLPLIIGIISGVVAVSLIVVFVIKKKAAK